MNNISSIIFDLGGVILNLDMSKTMKAMSHIMGIQVTDFFSFASFDAIFYGYEKGTLSTSQFIDELYAKAVIKVSRDDIIDAWNAMLIDIPEARVQTLEALTKHYRLFLLSNTNELHVDYFEKIVPCNRNFSDLFEKVYYSHIIGCRKPDERAFNIVLQENNLDVSSTLFVDDREDNIEAAKKLGFRTLHITEGLDIKDLFN